MQTTKSKNNCQTSMPSCVDIVNAISNDVCLKSDELIGGHVLKHGTLVVQYAGGFSTVFPFIKKDGKKVAVRCWRANIDNIKERCLQIAEFLKHDTSGYFVGFKYVPDAILIAGSLQPVVIMDWVEGDTLKNYVEKQGASKELFLDLAEKFRKMVEYLHSKNISHGDLQHGNIMVKPDGSLALIDYDSMYVDSLQGMTDAVKGLPGYQHPARDLNRLLSPKSDYFSELVIYLSLNIFAEDPDLWDEYAETEDLLFSREDFDNLRASKLYKVYSQCRNREIRLLMGRMADALSKRDIDELLPLETALAPAAKVDTRCKVNVEGIFSKINSLMPKPTPNRIPLPDVNDIIVRLNTLMDAIELNKQIPSIDINGIINKLNK